MVVGATSSERVLRWSANVVNLGIVVELILLKNLVNMQLCKLESSFIHALLLSVVHGGMVRYVIKLFFNELSREWSEFFQSNDKRFLILRERRVLELLHNVEVDLARAEHNLRHMLAISKSIRKNWLESGAWSKLFNRRDCSRVFQTDLGACKDQRFTIISQHLTSQKMEVVGGVGYLCKLEVNVGSCQVIIGTMSIINLRIDVLKESLYMAS